jgi:hypothetical protein
LSRRLVADRAVQASFKRLLDRVPGADCQPDRVVAEQLYRSFLAKGNPALKTTLAVMNAVGVELTATTPTAA